MVSAPIGPYQLGRHLSSASLALVTQILTNQVFNFPLTRTSYTCRRLQHHTTSSSRAHAPQGSCSTQRNGVRTSSTATDGSKDFRPSPTSPSSLVYPRMKIASREDRFNAFTDWSTRVDMDVDLEQSIKEGYPVPKVTLEHVRSSSVIGRRQHQEDRMVACSVAKKVLFLGIFDGHGSNLAVDFVSQRLPERVTNWLTATTNLQTALHQSFIDINNLYQRYLYTFHKNDSRAYKSGTTGTIALLRNSVELVVGSVGDSRAALCRDGFARPLSPVHHAELPNEQKRIKQRGGFIVSNSFGQVLVNGRLSMTRSFGDPELKHSGVIAIPDILSRKVRHHVDAFIILTTDGVSNVMNNQDVVDCILHCAHNSDEACRLVTDLAMQYGSDDNASCLLVPLGAWGKISSSKSGSGSRPHSAVFRGDSLFLRS